MTCCREGNTPPFCIIARSSFLSVVEDELKPCRLEKTDAGNLGSEGKYGIVNVSEAPSTSALRNKC